MRVFESEWLEIGNGFGNIKNRSPAFAAATCSFSSQLQMFPRNSRYRPKYASKANKLEPDKSFCYRGEAIDHASLFVNTFV